VLGDLSVAKVEQVTVSELYTAFHNRSDLTIDILLSEIHDAVPLSQNTLGKLSK
jgi:hypothetical protein